MKKGLLCTMILLLVSTIAFSSAPDDQLFSYDKQKVAEEFTELDQLEAFLVSNNGADNADVPVSFQLSSLEQQSSPYGVQFGLNDMDWISFAWGFLCCPVGFFVVAINDEKTRDEKTSYWIGVISATLLNGFGTIFWYNTWLNIY